MTLLRIASEELIVKEQPLVQLSQRSKPSPSSRASTPSSSQTSSSQSSEATSSSSSRSTFSTPRSDMQSQSSQGESRSQSQGGLCLSEARKLQLYEAFAAYVPQAIALLQQRLALISRNASTSHSPQPMPQSFGELCHCCMPMPFTCKCAFEI